MKIKEVLVALTFVQEIVIWNQDIQDFIPIPLELGKSVISSCLHYGAGYLGGTYANVMDIDLHHIFYAAGVMRVGVPQ